MLRLLDAAEAGGLVRRTPDPSDRRRRVVSLTDDGEAGLRAAMEVAHEIQEELLAPAERGRTPHPARAAGKAPD